MNKIEALKKTIVDLVDNKTEYLWTDPSHCNCGVVAKTLLEGKKPMDCGYGSAPVKGKKGCFSQFAYCMTTDLPLPLVFEKLKSAGFTHEELFELEYLTNKDIVSRMDGYYVNNGSMALAYMDGMLHYGNKKALILYLQKWVEILEEQQITEQKVVEPPKVKTVYVTISETLKEPITETQLN